MTSGSYKIFILCEVVAFMTFLSACHIPSPPSPAEFPAQWVPLLQSSYGLPIKMMYGPPPILSIG